MWSISNVQAFRRFLIGHIDVIEDCLCRGPDGYLVHQIAAYPKSSAKVIVTLDKKSFLTLSGKLGSGDEPAGTGPNNNHIVIDVVFKFSGKFRYDRLCYILFGYS